MNEQKSGDPRISIWLDCDTGHDDAYAILLAAHHPRSRLLGVSTVHGNASVHHTTANTCSILEAIGRSDVVVVQGEARPLSREPSFAPGYHGESGLDGVTLLPKPTSSQIAKMRFGIEEIYQLLIAERKSSIWLVATGPLTNVAKLIREHSDVLTRIRGISVMGGGIGGGFSNAPPHRLDGPGNWTRFAEFNIFCDPEAAELVFSNPQLKDKISLASLDLTHQCRANAEVLERLYGPSKLKRMMRQVLTFFAEAYKAQAGIVDGPPLHDPIAVLMVLAPELFDDGNGERWQIGVSLAEHELGRINITASDGGQRSFGHRVPRGVDVRLFWSTIEACLNEAERLSPLS